MPTIPELLVRIGADLSGFKKGMAAVVSSVQDTEAKITGAGKTLNRAFSGLAFGYGLKEVGQFGAEAVKKYAEQEAAVISLGASLQATGRGGRAALEQIAAGAGNVEEATGILDDDIMKATARLGQYARKLSAGDLADAQRAIVAFSVKTGNDLDASAKLIGRALASNQNVLGRQGIELNLNATQTQRLAQLNRQLAASYEVAKAEMDGTQGAITRMKNGWEKVKEALGGILVRSAGVGDGIQDIGKALYRFAAYLRENAGAIGAWGRVVFDVVKAVANTFVQLARIIYNLAGAWINFLMLDMKGAKASVTGVIDAFQDLGDSWVQLGKDYASAVLGKAKPLAELPLGRAMNIGDTGGEGGEGKSKAKNLAAQLKEQIGLYDLEVAAGRKSLDDKLAMIDREIAAHRKNQAVYLDLMQERLKVQKELRQEYLRTLEVLRQTMTIAPTPTERRERASELAQYGLKTPGVQDLVQQAAADLKSLKPVALSQPLPPTTITPIKIENLGDIGKAILQIRSLGDAGALLKASFGFLMKTVLPLAVIAEFVAAAMKPLEPALNALKAPIQLLATAIGSALIPILKALFPAIKIAVMAVSYLGSAIGLILKGIFGTLAKIPLIGKAFRGLADAGASLVTGMADTRRQLKNMTWESASATDSVSELGSAAKSASEDLKNLPNAFRYTLRKFQATVPIVIGEGAAGGIAPLPGRVAQPRGSVVYVQPGAITVNPAPSQNPREVAAAVVTELRRKSLQVTGTTQLATAWGG